MIDFFGDVGDRIDQGWKDCSRKAATRIQRSPRDATMVGRLIVLKPSCPADDS